MFRAIHTIKGTCGFLGFTKLEGVSHVGESLLSCLRDGDTVLDAPITTALFGMVDAIREILASIERTGGEGDADYTAVLQSLRALNDRCSRAGNASPVAEFVASVEDHAPVPADDRKPGVSDSTLRVDVGLMDTLMNLVGELVFARDQVLQFTTTTNDASLLNAMQRLDLVTSELQESVMKTRMQPIGNVWSKFPRVARDLASACGKQVRVEMEGRDTALDRTIVEAIKDPLTHIIRNCVDHGLERPADRIERGKRAEGTIRLHAFHEGGQVNIEISDDGAGIAADRVRQRALAQGLITREQSQRLSDHDVIALIFLPGFSTAETITNVSGRGVGMDVVKTNIERIGGTVGVHSVAGTGTTLRIKIPLTLAITPALMVPAGAQRSAIHHIHGSVRQDGFLFLGAPRADTQSDGRLGRLSVQPGWMPSDRYRSAAGVARGSVVPRTESAMQYLEQEIISLTQYIWGATVNLDAVPLDAAAPSTPGGRTLEGVINITGAWAGALVLQVPEQVARRAAAVMFELDESATSLEDMQDAVGEITSMTGGNVKALLEGQCALSLPAVVEGRDYSIRVPGSEAVTRVTFDIEGAPFVVSLLTRRERAATAKRESQPTEFSNIL